MNTLIIIDDEKIVRDGLKNIIEWNSFNFNIIGEASDGDTAVEVIEKLRPDLALIDIRMPEIGRASCRERVCQ